MITSMKKKLIAVLALASLLVTGCQNTSPGTPAATAAPSSADASPAGTSAASPKITITNLVDFHVLDDPADMSEYKWMDKNDTSFTGISLQESIRFFTEKGSGILVFSAPTCPFCNRAMPILDDVLAEYGIRAYYVDTNQPIASDMATSMQLYNELFDYLVSIFELDDNGQPMFQIPEVVAIKDGQIMGHHLSLVESFTIADEDSQMNEEQTEELKQIYRKLIESCAD